MAFIEQARRRGRECTYDDFKKISQYASSFDEEGRYIFDKSKFFYLHEDGKFKKELFDEMIREPVYKLLKYHGNFCNMVTSKFFIDPKQKNEFFFKASLKVPFYLIYESSPNIQTELMTKYLENPFNSITFVSYNQEVPGLSQLASTDPKVERRINLDVAYSKFKKAAPSVLCIGTPASRKSTMLNDIFAT